MSQISKDEAACEGKLGKEPPVPKEKKTIILSENIAERLQTGIVDEDRIQNYENYWLDKLACMDESHSLRNNLDIVEAESTLNRLAEWVESRKPKPKSQDYISLKECLEKSRDGALQCNESVQQFIESVDQLMYDAVRKNYRAPPREKLTYAEKFRRGLTSQ